MLLMTGTFRVFFSGDEWLVQSMPDRRTICVVKQVEIKRPEKCFFPQPAPAGSEAPRAYCLVTGKLTWDSTYATIS
jgi:hypothetical protein